MGRFRRRQQPVVEAPEEDDGPVPARFNFARDVVEAAAGDPFRAALTYVDREGIIDRRTFKALASDASRWSALLRSRGLVPGDRVLVLVGKKPAWLSVVLGALKAGLVTVPCPESSQPHDIAFRVEHSGSQVVVVDAARAHVIGGLELAAKVVVVEDVKSELGAHETDEPTHDTAADDTAFILYTSGAMGEPLGVIHTHANTWAARLQAEHWLDARRGDLIWCTAGTGTTQSIWNVLLGPWSCGAEVALHDGGFDVEERFDLLQRLGVTVLCQTPTEYRLLAEHPELEQFYLGSIRHAVATGEPLSPELIASFRVGFGLTIHDGYGQTENTILVANLPGTEIKPGSIGQPLPDHDVVVIDAEGNEQLAGVEGEIALRGKPPSLFGGYWNAPDETRAAFRGEWYLTGDRAIRDQDGYLWFAGGAERVIVGAADRIQAYGVASPPVAAGRPVQETPPEQAPKEPERTDESVRLEEAQPAAATDDRPVQETPPEQAPEEPERTDESVRLEEAQPAAATDERPVQETPPEQAPEELKRTDESVRLEEAQAAAAAAAAAALAAEAAAAAAAEAARQARGTDAEARRAAEARQAALARVEAEEQRRLMDAQRREAAIAAVAKVRRDEAEARRAAETRVEAEAQQRLEDARSREAAIAAAAQLRRDEAEAARAAEASAEAAERQRQQDEGRRREEEQATTEQERREEAESRRAAKARARAEEQQRKQDERQRREAEHAAAEQARRDEVAARRASEARAKEEERQRKQDEKQRREAEKAAAEQSRRDAAARQAAESRAREEEEQGRARAALLRAAEKGQKAAVGSRSSGPPTATDTADEEEDGLSPELIARLRAYGHGDDVSKREAPKE